MADTYVTRQSLLWKVKELDNQEAWDEFVALYRPFIHILLRGMYISENESDDIVQNVMVRIFNNIASFEVDGPAKFRTWLITVVKNSTFTHMKKISKDRERDKEYSKLSHTTTPAGECVSEDNFEAHYQQQWERYLCTLALENLKSRFTGKAITVFTMSLDEIPDSTICEKLSIKQDSVYRLRPRIKNALIEEIAHLRKQLEW